MRNEKNTAPVFKKNKNCLNSLLNKLECFGRNHVCDFNGAARNKYVWVDVQNESNNMTMQYNFI